MWRRVACARLIDGPQLNFGEIDSLDDDITPINVTF